MAASMGAGDDGSAPFIDSSRLDLRRYARRPALAMVLADYLVYVERNPRKALDLAAESTSLKEFKDWWWKARLGKCYYKLGAPDIPFEMRGIFPCSFISVFALHKCSWMSGRIGERVDVPMIAFVEGLSKSAGNMVSICWSCSAW